MEGLRKKYKTLIENAVLSEVLSKGDIVHDYVLVNFSHPSDDNF